MITIWSYLEVVGHDPEMADFDNPKGEIIKELWQFVHTDPTGRRKVTGCFGSLKDIQDAPIPVLDDTWEETYPEYGSLAYQEDEAWNLK
jgi:hypothetical protein